MQRDGKRSCVSSLHRPNLKPSGQRQHAAANGFRRPRIGQFLVYRDGYKNLLKQLCEQIFLFDGDEIPEWCSVGDGSHSTSLLTWVAARRRFE